MLYSSNTTLIKLGHTLLFRTAEDDFIYKIKSEFVKTISNDLCFIIKHYLDSLDKAFSSTYSYSLQYRQDKVGWIWRIGNSLMYYINNNGESYKKLIDFIFKCYDYVEFCSKSSNLYFVNDFEDFKDINENFINQMNNQFYLFNNEDSFIKAKIKELTEQDWRPSETVPEDYYAL